MAAHQAPPSLGFSRQEHWSELPCPFLLQYVKMKSESEAAQLCLTLSDPMDCSLPGSSIHGIFPGKSPGVECHCLLCQTSLSRKKLHEGGVQAQLDSGVPTMAPELCLPLYL